MGVYTSTQLNGTAILAAAERINPDKIFFIHNHPSGNLKPSQADRNVYSQLYSLFGDKLEDAIIINLKSGMFAIFNSNYDIEQTNYTPIKSNPVKVYSFNKQVFDKDYDPSGNFMITSPNDVASFISGHRLGNRKKMNIMIINNGVVANMFTKYTAVTDENVEEVAKESVLMATNYGGIAVVVYGDIGNIGDNAVAKLKKLIGIYSGGQISLLDFISVEGNNYKSSFEEGLMEPAQEYPTNKVNEDEILFRDGEMKFVGTYTENKDPKILALERLLGEEFNLYRKSGSYYGYVNDTPVRLSDHPSKCEERTGGIDIDYTAHNLTYIYNKLKGIDAFENVNAFVVDACKDLDPQELLEFLGMLVGKAANTTRALLAEDAANEVLKTMVGVK